MTKFLGFPLTTIGATAIVLVSVFAATQLYTAPAIAAVTTSVGATNPMLWLENRCVSYPTPSCAGRLR